MADTEFDVEVDETPEDENVEGGKETEQKDTWTPPSKEEWERVIKAKDRYKSEAQKRREKLQERETGNESGDAGDEKDVSKAIERARLDAENVATAKYRGIIGRQAAKTAFMAAGLKGKPDGLLKLIDFDELEIEDDGEVTGLEDQVRQLKSDYPELFSRTRSGVRDKDGSDKRPPSGKAKSATEKALEAAYAKRSQ